MTILSRILQRLPIITHVLLTATAILGPSYTPRLLAVIFFLTNVGFVTSQVRMAYGMLRCFLGIRSHWKTDWWSVYLDGLQTVPNEVLETRATPTTLSHLIIIPSYKEDVTTLRQTLSVLASHPLATYTYKVCLAMEEREVGANVKGPALASEFRSKFADIVVTYHPSDIPDEVPGKGSNTRWATRWMSERELADKERLQEDDLDAIITVMDADTAFAADYFLAVSVRYLLATPRVRKNMMFVPPIIFDRNQSEVPAVTRVTDIMWCTAGISGIYPSSSVKIPTSAYSVSLHLANHVGFWDAGAGAIGEDMHMFCKALFDTRGNLHVETIYSPASQCNVVGDQSDYSLSWTKSFISDCRARWSQAVRHMWGSLDTGYVATRILTGDFGVSAQREIEHRLNRVEMRQKIIESQTLPSPSTEAPEVKIFSPSGLERTLFDTPLPTAAIGSTQSFPRHQSHASTASATSEDESLDRFSTPGSLASTSYTSMEETEDIPLQKISRPTRSRNMMTRHYQKRPSRQRLVLKPFIILAGRMYEAHIMLAHLIILMIVLVLGPKLIDFVERQLALQGFVWGRTSLLPDIENEIGATTWSFHDETLLPATMKFCQNLGAIGGFSTVVTLFLHDLYHREARKRWKANNGKRLMQRQRRSTSTERLEMGPLLQAPFDQFDLGIPPSPRSDRRLPWCWLDYLAIPGSLAFGVAPLLYAQVCHLWTDRLAYKVSAKPQVR